MWDAARESHYKARGAASGHVLQRTGRGASEYGIPEDFIVRLLRSKSSRRDL